MYSKRGLSRAELLHVEQTQDVSLLDELRSPLVNEESPSVPPMIEPHPDERQVRLDTDRSFVLYPVGEPFSHPMKVFRRLNSVTVNDMQERERKQNELHDLIVEVFRKRRKLSYFQVRTFYDYKACFQLKSAAGIP